MKEMSFTRSPAPRAAAWAGAPVQEARCRGASLSSDGERSAQAQELPVRWRRALHRHELQVGWCPSKQHQTDIALLNSKAKQCLNSEKAMQRVGLRRPPVVLDQLVALLAAGAPELPPDALALAGTPVRSRHQPSQGIPTPLQPFPSEPQLPCTHVSPMAARKANCNEVVRQPS